VITLAAASSPRHLDDFRVLCREYAASLHFSLDYQGFDAELASLPGKYAPPQGAVILAYVRDEPAGAVALRDLGDSTCEMKRMFVRPRFRGLSLGHLLGRAVVAEGRRLRYARMRLDTESTFLPALAVYRALGFSEIPAYNDDPQPDTLWFERDLAVPLAPLSEGAPSASSGGSTAENRVIASSGGAPSTISERPRKRLMISTGSPWEPVVGYSRAVMTGNRVAVAGTTAVDAQGHVVLPNDPAAQTAFILDKIAAALALCGQGLEHVTRTRIFVTDISQWEAIGKAHAAAFRAAGEGTIRPAATMVEVTALVDPKLLVEIEADAEA
jgi:enamine deaminase RidA (YjgF/YER057c/UK114 family)/GNAT superfamily N-acetyltransferase